MANVIGPFGFSQVGTASGPVNFASSGNPPYRIAANNATAIFYGDAVYYVSPDTGYLTQWASGTGTANIPLVGIFTGCKYFSTSQRKMVWNNYWPGSDATGDVEAFVVDDPNSKWIVQAASGPITQAMLGFGADVTVGSGNTTTGISAMSLTTPSATAANTLPFKVVNLITTPPGANGTDITTVGNYVVVAFNNQIYKQLAGST